MWAGEHEAASQAVPLAALPVVALLARRVLADRAVSLAAARR